MFCNPTVVRFAALATLLLASTASHAQTVTSTVEGNVGGVLTSDSSGPSTTTVSSQLDFPQAFTVDFSADGTGRAAQRPDGVGAVFADAVFANGATQNSVVARTLWVDSATNNSGSPLVYEFDFLVTPASLRIADFAGLEDSDPSRPDISFQIFIRSNGVTLFEAGASLIGGSVSHVLLESGTSLSPTFVGGGTVFGYDFQPFSDVLNLGVFAPGEIVTVEYEMIATVDTPGFEAGGLAKIGDPFDLNSTPGFVGTFIENGAVASEGSSWGEVKSLYE